MRMSLQIMFIKQKLQREDTWLLFSLYYILNYEN